MCALPTNKLYIEPPHGMTNEQKQLLEEEDSFRKLFAEKRFMFTGKVHYNRYLACQNVWENIEQFQYQEETEEEKKVPKILTNYRKSLTGSAVVGKDEFLRRWEAFTLGIFNGMDWNNVYVAGGAVLACLCNPNMDDTFKGSDIDLFIWGIYDEETANSKLRHIHNIVMKNTSSNGSVVRTKRAVTILCQYPYRHVQVILRLYKNPGEVLLGFDIDSCGVGFDGKDVYAEERFRRALCKGYNLVNKSRRSTTYEIRLHKYSKRGFCVAVPDLDKERVNPKIFEKHLSEAEGLCKLLLFEHSSLHPSSPFVKSRNTNNVMAMEILNQQVNKSENLKNIEEGRLAEIEALNTEHPSDYSDLYIPWGPTWYANNITRMLKYKEKMFQAKQAKRYKNKKIPSRVKHQHRFVFGIDGAITGKSPWCIICKQPHIPNPEKDKKYSTTKYINGPIEWMVDVPAYQDYDNGFLRCLMSGSFEPVNTNFEEGVYLTDEEITDGHKSLIKYLLGRPIIENENIDIIDNDNTEIVFNCKICKQIFPSLNRLRKHKRIGCEKDIYEDITNIQNNNNNNQFHSPILLGKLEINDEDINYQQDSSDISLSNNIELKPSYEIDEDFIPTWLKPIPTTNSIFTKGLNVELPKPKELSQMTKQILILSNLYKNDKITKEQQKQLKSKILEEDEITTACFDAFAIDNDEAELLDSLITIINILTKE